eukprot:m.240126 g.240126  ORF g.240126 m.240126 type:complete len:140 (+) comp23101_c0_seq1:189-608(+)
MALSRFWRRIPHPTELSSSTIFIFVLLAYFALNAGVIYDLVAQPPSMGETVDEAGRVRQQSVMPGRLNGQYINEGLVGGLMVVLGGLALVMLETANTSTRSSVFRISLAGAAVVALVIAVSILRLFMNLKLPNYLVFAS